MIFRKMRCRVFFGRGRCGSEGQGNGGDVEARINLNLDPKPKSLERSIVGRINVTLVAESDALNRFSVGGDV